MIVVIADDFSGAAEIGGVALHYGLESVIQTDTEFDNDRDLLIIDSNTRSVSDEQAAQEIENIAKRLLNTSWRWIYKKTDSVLRGHILTELSMLLKILANTNVLLIPQNPERGRVIINGEYFIDGLPLHLTNFAFDPDFPRSTSQVLGLLDNLGTDKPKLALPGSKIHGNSITVGNADSKYDINTWAEQLPPETLPAGGSEFFEAILKTKGYLPHPLKKELYDWRNKNILVICGSTSLQYKQLINWMQEKNFIICTIPCNLDELDIHCLKRWQEEIANAFDKTGKVVVSLGQSPEVVQKKQKKLTDILVESAVQVLRTFKVDELFIEGGDTSSTILRKLGWKCLIPFDELALGVVRMKVIEEPSIILTTKPGSYSWPAN